MSRPKGLDAHLARLNKLNKEARSVAGAIAFEGADTIKAEAQRSISAGSVSGKNHVPSKPGKPPNFDTGFLSGAIVTIQSGPLTAEVGALAPYSAALEFGTSRVKARPFMRPARDKKKAEIQKRFASQMKTLVKRSRQSGG